MAIPNPPLSSIAAQHVKRVDSDYKISVPSGGKIFLDTGSDAGLVYITGDLTVQGNATTVNVTNLAIEDNTIILNSGESGFGVTLGTAGIEIDRGTATKGNAQFLWDETMNYVNPASGLTEYGLFVFKTKANNQVVGIRTNSIDTNGQDLALISRGTGVVTVSGTTDYERQVLNYNAGLVSIDDDTIPNIKAVTDKIFYDINNNPGDKIRRDDTLVIVYDNNIAGRITYFDTGGAITTSIRLFHNLTTNLELGVNVGSYVTITNSGIPYLDGTWQVIGADSLSQFFIISIFTPTALSMVASATVNVYVNNSKSNTKVIIDGSKVAEFQDNHIDFYSLRFEDTTISTTASNTDLVLTSEGTGSVQIQDNLRLMNVGLVPSNPPSGSLKIYSNAEGPGGTGIYFVNDHYAQNVGDNRRDELISKKKAIAFSILM